MVDVSGGRKDFFYIDNSRYASISRFFNVSTNITMKIMSMEHHHHHDDRILRCTIFVYALIGFCVVFVASIDGVKKQRGLQFPL